MRKRHIWKKIAAIALTAAVLVGGGTATFLSENVQASDADIRTETTLPMKDSLYEEYIKVYADEEYIRTDTENVKIVGVLQTDIILSDKKNVSGAAVVYSMDENDNYYVAYVDTMQKDTKVDMTSVSFKDVDGKNIEGCVLDADTGIVYIPVNAYEGGICAELKYDMQEEKSSKAVSMAVVRDEELSASAVYQTSMDGDNVSLFSEAGLEKDSVAVIMNGIPLSEDRYVYNPETGQVSVTFSPAAVSMVSVIQETDVAELDRIRQLAEEYADQLPGRTGMEEESGDGAGSETDIERIYEIMLGGSEHAALAFADSNELSMELKAGESVELKAFPEPSYTVRSITLMDAESGEILSEVEGEDNLFSFEMPAADVYVILNVTKIEKNVTIQYIGAPGNVTTDIEEKEPGEPVTAAVEPGDGCSMQWIAVYDGETGVEICTEETEGGYTFILPESGKVTIETAFVYDTELLSTMTEFKYLEHSTACTYNAGNYIGNRFGITNAQVMSWLNSHRNDNYYLGTAYHISSKNGGSDNRQPNGDAGWESADGYGYDDYKGTASLNCTGFVWHALWRSCTQVWGCDYNTAYNGIPAWGGIGAGNWATFLRSGNYEYRTYFTKYGATDFWSVVAMLTDMSNDGYLQPGDIIWTWDANSGSPSVGFYNGDGYAINVGDGLSTASSDYHHTGIYIGDGKWWHSIRNSAYNANLIEATNQISDITPKTQCKAITVVKMNQPKGYLTLKKSSADPSVTNGNSSFSLEGAVYGVYKDAACTQAAVEGFLASLFFTDADGNCGKMELPAGNYYVKEETAPKGYQLDTKVYPVTVTADHTTTAPLVLSVKDTPALGKLSVKKVSGAPILTDGNACYSLKGAVYTVYSDKACTTAVKTLTTDENGNTQTVDITSGTYYIKETTASPGYLLCDGSLDGVRDGIHTVTVKTGETTTFTCKEPPANDPFALVLQKMDYDTDAPNAQGIASLEGAIFELTYYTNIEGKTEGTPFRTWYFRTNENGKLYCDSEGYLVTETTLNDGTVLKSDVLYFDPDTKDVIYPLGTYCFKEVSSPMYYQLEGTMNFVQNPDGKTDVKTGLKAIIKQPENGSEPQIYDGDRVTNQNISAENLAINVYDKTEDGSIKIVKLATDTQKPLAGVTFKLVGLEDGTELTGVTDSNGEIIWNELIPQNYVITEVSTVDGYSLLKDNIEITLPIEMTVEEITSNGADINKAVYDEVAGKYCFYDATITVGETVTFNMPMTGDNQTIAYLVLGFAFALICGGLALAWRMKRRKAEVLL